MIFFIENTKFTLDNDKAQVVWNKCLTVHRLYRSACLHEYVLLLLMLSCTI